MAIWIRLTESRGECNIARFDRRLLKDPSPINLRPPARGLRRIALPGDLKYCHPLFREMDVRFINAGIAVSGNYRQIRRSAPGFAKIGPTEPCDCLSGLSVRRGLIPLRGLFVRPGREKERLVLSFVSARRYMGAGRRVLSFLRSAGHYLRQWRGCYPWSKIYHSRRIWRRSVSEVFVISTNTCDSDGEDYTWIIPFLSLQETFRRDDEERGLCRHIDRDSW